jgi:8-amino-7-oxononanoate synthase
MSRTDIAIIGMGCRFPGADDVPSLWRTLTAATTHIGDVPADRWDAALFHDDNPRAANKSYTRRLATVSDIRAFAPEAYGITPKRARAMDPQQRLLLDCTRVAIEDAGYARRPLPADTTGVYVGVSVSEHKDIVTSPIRLPQALAGAFGATAHGGGHAARLTARVPSFHAYSMVGQMLNMNAANISQVFGFGGPSFAIDTACSSALVALHEAVLHLRHGIVDAAVVGGVYISLDPAQLVAFSRIGALSRRGHCAPFDSRADGFVLGEGAGAILLKRADDARRDGDRVWAVINGIAVNNDGRGEGPMTPSRAGQLAVLTRAYANAGIAPSDVSLVEGHGTATAAGDAAEVGALADLFQSGGEEPRALTSVKANLGHALAASGMASLIKAVLSLHHATIPAQAGFMAPRASLGLAAAGLFVPRQTSAWPARRPRCAGVSSFGFGGTNAHVVLSAAPTQVRQPRVHIGGVPVAAVPVVVSAPSAELLTRHLRELASTVAELPADTAVADVAFTLASRQAGAFQATAIAATTTDLAEALRTARPAEQAVGPTVELSYSGCAAVSLPPSPLITRPLWILDPQDVNDTVALELDEETVGRAAAIPAATPAAADVERAVFAAISTVSAYPIEHLALSSVLGSELGFDSLMSAELASELAGVFPQVSDDVDKWFSRDLTIAGVIARITEALSLANDAHPSAADQLTNAVQLSLAECPWLRDHTLNGAAVVPMAFVVDLCAAYARAISGPGQPIGISELKVVQSIPVGSDETVQLRLRGNGVDRVTVEMARASSGPWSAAYHAKVSTPPVQAALQAPAEREIAATVDVPSFYRGFPIHGPTFRALAAQPTLTATSVSGRVHDGARGAGGQELPVVLFDAALQVAAFWSVNRLGRMALPIGADAVTIVTPMAGLDELQVFGALDTRDGDTLSAHLDLRSASGELVAQVRGLRARLVDLSGPRPSPPPIADATWQVEAFPEVKALHERKAQVEAAGLAVPYFTEHQSVARDTSIVGGRSMISFSTYNYLGLSGREEVTEAAVDAVRRYGTSVSASRVAAGERPVHRELERELASFLGCADALLFVGGHATNVSTIGHLVGPQDVVLYDAWAHDSIIGGARLSGARHRSFAHNDMTALDRLLTDLRPHARRVLICVEGVYSMDGDLAPLDRIVELKKRHRALLLVDEAHSLGVLGPTGRGAGEHFNICRTDVDLWMGTLSKALASCGGYIAGSAALVDYLRFTVPGFVYSVGLSPANAAAALAALNTISREPGLVSRLQQRAERFRQLCRHRGIDTGASAHSAVVPCIVGESSECLRVAAALNQQGIAVHPIVYPAVEEHLARLRFFVSALHSDSQLEFTADTLGRELDASHARRAGEPVEAG